eukprot:12357607-Ditylum_brightwellii.AAC.1
MMVDVAGLVKSCRSRDEGKVGLLALHDAECLFRGCRVADRHEGLASMIVERRCGGMGEENILP